MYMYSVEVAGVSIVAVARGRGSVTIIGAVSEAALALVWTQFSRSIFVSDLTPLHTCEHLTVVSQRMGVLWTSTFYPFIVI